MSNSQPVITSKWNEFPATYRAEAVATILHWVKLGESGVVIGGSGSGKSNIAGFIAQRPDVTSQLLPGNSADYYFFMFDFNGLSVVNATNLYRTLFDTLLDTVEHEPDLYNTLAAILHRLPAAFDDPALYYYRALQRAHQHLIQQAGKQVIWLFDRFDEAIKQLDAPTLNSLRRLRDQCKDKLSYIAFTRHPLAQLRPPAEYDEFHEIMIMHSCWVGAMNARDGHWIAEQVMKRYKIPIDESIIAILQQQCGGWPAFLKIAFSAWAEGELLPATPLSSWQKIMLANPAFQRNCQEIWDSCTAIEQQQLLHLATQPTLAAQNFPHLDSIGTLVQSGWVIQPLPGEAETAEFALFSPLFAQFVRQQKQTTERGITIRNGLVYRDGVPLTEQLTPLELRLLEYFCEHADEEVCTKEDLDRHVWPHEHRQPDEIYDNDQRLTALIKRLRPKLEEGQHWAYIHAVRGRGYQFKQPG